MNAANYAAKYAANYNPEKPSGSSIIPAGKGFKVGGTKFPEGFQPIGFLIVEAMIVLGKDKDGKLTSRSDIITDPEELKACLAKAQAKFLSEQDSKGESKPESKPDSKRKSKPESKPDSKRGAKPESKPKSRPKPKHENRIPEDQVPVVRAFEMKYKTIAPKTADEFGTAAVDWLVQYEFLKESDKTNFAAVRKVHLAFHHILHMDIPEGVYKPKKGAYTIDHDGNDELEDPSE